MLDLCLEMYDNNCRQRAMIYMRSAAILSCSLSGTIYTLFQGVYLSANESALLQIKLNKVSHKHTIH